MSQIPSASQTPVTTDAFKHIETVVLASAAASVSFAGLDTVNRAWRVQGFVKNDANAKDVYLRFNADAVSNYATQAINANSTSVSGARATGAAQVNLMSLGTMGASETGSFSLIVAKSAAGVKAQVVGVTGQNASPQLELSGGEWDNTADLLSRIDLLASSNNFAANTSVSLYGAPRS